MKRQRLTPDRRGHDWVRWNESRDTRPLTVRIGLLHRRRSQLGPTDEAEEAMKKQRLIAGFARESKLGPTDRAEEEAMKKQRLIAGFARESKLGPTDEAEEAMKRQRLTPDRRGHDWVRWNESRDTRPLTVRISKLGPTNEAEEEAMKKQRLIAGFARESKLGWRILCTGDVAGVLCPTCGLVAP